MPITYHFDQSLELLVVQATGHVTIEDRAEFVANASVDNDLPAVTPILIDASHLSNTPTDSDIPIMARLVVLLAGRFHSRIAYYVSGVGLVTLYTLAAEQVDSMFADARAFSNREDAIRWLKR